MFLHTANRLCRLGACLEGQLHSETWGGREEGERNVIKKQGGGRKEWRKERRS